MDTAPTAVREPGVDPAVHAPPPMSHAPPDREDRSLADLIKELRDESSTLVRQEIALAKTEIGEKVSTFGRNAAYAAAGAAVLLIGGIFLLLAVANVVSGIVFHLAPSLGSWVSGAIGYAIVGLVIAIVGYAFYQKGVSTLKTETPVPEKTVASLQENKEWLKNKTS